MKCELLYSKTRNESGSKFKIFGKSRDLKMPSLKSRNKHAAKISCNKVINVRLKVKGMFIVECALS